MQIILEELEKHPKMLLGRLQEEVVDFANALEAACVQLKRRIGEFHTVGVSNETFTRLPGWQQSQGNRIGTFEFTTPKANNNSDAFDRAYSILKASHAAIGNRFHDKGYQFGYWLFDGKPDTIYRQVLRGK